MKKELLKYVLFLCGFASYSQVGIGTVLPNASSQLEIVANDKGVLIPRIDLKGLTDTVTITNGNINANSSDIDHPIPV